MSVHARISYIKSTVRILGYATLLIWPIVGVFALIVAEILGIVEESGL